MDSSDQNRACECPGMGAMSDAIGQLTSRSQMLNALQLIIDSHALVSITDRAGRIIYANDRFCEISQYHRDDLIGNTHRVVKSDCHPPSFYEQIWAAITSGESWTGDVQNKARDGSLYWVQSTISPIFDEQNRIVGYGSIRTDVTAQRQLMDELHDSEQKAHATLNSAINILDSSLLVVDASGHILTTNQSYSAMYPESAGEDRPGAHVGALIKKQQPGFSDEKLESVVREILANDTTEQHVLKDGRTVKIQRRVVPEGGFVSLHTDISDVIRQTRLLERQTATMDLMKAIAVDANESPDAESAYARCLERVCKFTGWEVGHVYLRSDDGAGQSIPSDTWYCTGGDNFESFREKTAVTTFEAGSGLPGRVLQNSSPAWIHDITIDPGFPRAAVAKKDGLVGGVAFPVMLQDEVIAVLEFFSSQPMASSPELEEILSHLCDQMSRVAERERSEKTFRSRVASEISNRDRKLVEQNERFDAALKNMTQGLCMFDSEQRLIVSNPRYAEMYDLQPGLLKPGTTLRQIIEYRIANGIYAGANPEEYIQERLDWVSSGSHSNKTQHLSDGRSISITHQPMPGGGWVTTHEDITARIESEKALLQSEGKFKTLVESTNVVPWEFNPATMRFTYVGPQAVPLLGFPVEDWYGEGFWERSMHPDDREKTIRICAEATRLCQDHDFEYRVLTADGGTVWVRDVVSVVVEDGEATGLRGILIDISDRMKANEALKSSEQRFKDIVEVSSDWIWECDEKLRFTYFSERFSQVTGVPRERVLGKTRHDIGMDDTADWAAHIADLEARRPFREFRYSVKGENGETQHWMVSGRPVFDENGAFKGYRGTGADRTAEVRDEAELIRHRDHLQELVNDATAELKQRADELHLALAKEKELNQLQSQFVSMASHEFRTPLAIIDGAAQRLRRRAESLTPEDTVKRVDKIRGAVSRMTQLMESTLVAARLEAGRPTIQISDCNISSLLREVCDRQQDIAQKHVISCNMRDLPDTIRADSVAVEQIFTNLLSNAVKYSQHAPDIEVTAHLEKEDLIVLVRDHGIGIDEEDLPSMFQRFFRARTSTGIAGTGIGLNLVKTLVELHSGSIEVQSTKSEGSTFTVRLPVAGPATADETGGRAA